MGREELIEKHFVATVHKCTIDADAEFVELVLKCDHELGAQSGQFVTLETIPGKMFRRPFSVCWQEKNIFALKIQIVGENTEYYSTLKKGEAVSVCGPLGQPIKINSSVKNYILVTGGIGMAGLMLLAQNLSIVNLNSSVTILHGDRNEKRILAANFLKTYCDKLETITDDQGKVTDLLEKFLRETSIDSRQTEIIACGPMPMLEKVAAIAKEQQLPCQVIMENLMACGVGSCKGCAIPRVGGGYFHLCQDGPALPGDKIDWQALCRPSVKITGQKIKQEDVKMQVILAGENKDIRQGKRILELSSPIILDSGCIDYEAIQTGVVDVSCVGAIKSKGITMEPRAGNKPPRVCETASGMLNSIGLENVGLKNFISEHLPKLNSLGKPVIVNISGSTVKEFRDMAIKLSDAGVQLIELNISCPNTERGGEIFGKSDQDTFNITSYVRDASPSTFLIVKLSPMAANVVEIARAAEEGGADAIAGFNTYLGMKIDLATRRPAIGNIYGGMSGPAVMPMALRMVHLLCQSGLKIPVIGGTGITSGADAAEYIIAGAQAITIGSGLFTNPSAALKVFRGLRKIVAGYGMTDIKQLVGSLIL